MVRRETKKKEDLNSFKEEIIHQFHIVSEGLRDQIKQVAESVVVVNQKLDRFREEIKGEIEEKYGILSHHPINILSGKVEETRQGLEETRQELKEEIQETRREILAATKFS